MAMRLFTKTIVFPKLDSWKDRPRPGYYPIDSSLSVLSRDIVLWVQGISPVQRFILHGMGTQTSSLIIWLFISAHSTSLERAVGGMEGREYFTPFHSDLFPTFKLLSALQNFPASTKVERSMSGYIYGPFLKYHSSSPNSDQVQFYHLFNGPAPYLFMQMLNITSVRKKKRDCRLCPVFSLTTSMGHS
ncbi:hypothetical protein OIU78_001645 [Salix suchowensis]|nr:hypothetical protein OIU78_001645 [Salix suchowensis]